MSDVTRQHEVHGLGRVTAVHVTRVVDFLAGLQSNTAPITLTIGGVSETNTVQDDVVIVHAAPSSVVQAIVNEFKFVRLTSRGLEIPVHREG